LLRQSLLCQKWITDYEKIIDNFDVMAVEKDINAMIQRHHNYKDMGQRGVTKPGKEFSYENDDLQIVSGQKPKELSKFEKKYNLNEMRSAEILNRKKQKTLINDASSISIHQS
jgi:hypothetical protein